MKPISLNLDIQDVIRDYERIDTRQEYYNNEKDQFFSPKLKQSDNNQKSFDSFRTSISTSTSPVSPYRTPSMYQNSPISSSSSKKNSSLIRQQLGKNHHKNSNRSLSPFDTGSNSEEQQYNSNTLSESDFVLTSPYSSELSNFDPFDNISCSDDSTSSNNMLLSIENESNRFLSSSKDGRKTESPNTLAWNYSNYETVNDSLTELNSPSSSSSPSTSSFSSSSSLSFSSSKSPSVPSPPTSSLFKRSRDSRKNWISSTLNQCQSIDLKNRRKQLECNLAHLDRIIRQQGTNHPNSEPEPSSHGDLSVHQDRKDAGINSSQGRDLESVEKAISQWQSMDSSSKSSSSRMFNSWRRMPVQASKFTCIGRIRRRKVPKTYDSMVLRFQKYM
eukprot:gb/GECH01009419.1/.p1 GENE.gb/GECH01009419.1/~~gb/GECH01009419.1/.p1  ORF type:complete len:388 (+),score=96.10 gb/GECH01009419.1/:1-1164(+)